MQISRRLQHGLLVLHRAVDPRPRGLAAAGRARRRGRAAWPPTACARSRCWARTSTPTGATCARAASFAELLHALDGDRRARPHPLHEPAPEGHARGRDPRPRRAGQRLRAHPPAAAVGLLAGPQGDAAHLHARALPGPRRADPRARPGLRDHHRHHRRLPGGDRGGLRARRSRSPRRSASTAPSRSSTRRAAAPRRPRSRTTSSRTRSCVERMERLVEVVQRRARERAQRFVGRTLDVLVEGTSRTDPSRLRGRTRHNKVVNFDGLAQPGEIVPVAITSATQPDADGRGVAARPRPRVAPLQSIRLVCEHMFVCGGIRSRSSRIEQGAPPGLPGRAVVRRFDAPEALDTRFHEVRAKSALNRSRGRRGCRSAGRSTRTEAAAMPASTASRARRTSTWTSTRGGTSSGRSSSRSTCRRCCGPSWRGRRGRASTWRWGRTRTRTSGSRAATS